jgi:hypothetical protein
MALCKKHNVQVAFGSDLLASLEMKKMLPTEFTNRTKWFSNAEILAQATSLNGEVLALSGPRNPIPENSGLLKKARWPTFF